MHLSTQRACRPLAGRGYLVTTSYQYYRVAWASSTARGWQPQKLSANWKPSQPHFRRLGIAPSLQESETPESGSTGRGDVGAIVVGGGPAGIAVVGNLLEQLGPDKKIIWVDRQFSGGRIPAKYSEVPSNTTVALFIKYAQAVQPLRAIHDAAAAEPGPNAIKDLQSLDQDGTCKLSYAGDMLALLTKELTKHPRVKTYKGTVELAVRNTSTPHHWIVSLAQQDEGPAAPILDAPILVYCTGSSPTPPVSLLPGLDPLKPMVGQPLDASLDWVLSSSLSQNLPRDKKIIFGVVGASHSAIVVLLILAHLQRSSHPLLEVKWFTRSKSLKYAVYEDGWIRYDNTGLKGIAAEFARYYLEGVGYESIPRGKGNVWQMLGPLRAPERIDCSGGFEAEKEAYMTHLPACDYVVQAIGYTRDPLPVTASPVDGVYDSRRGLTFDHETGEFTNKETGKPVPGLFGAGIAFPERVVDKAGNVEHAVGLWKFMRFLKRVVPTWVEKTAEAKNIEVRE
ncbi:pyridine nucleotide-disulfide oxidoreductase-domain-containing protein [Podospora didyma]|uniref:Pyridine nucleotide-disulfide oxidoreductase-domain-containing protein n=1 Tax=Podospora didyma TaxID=330526 RepID=A0AAE0KB01_9PEZI|nr:pyridine nucleotide-disulfide oxidoreductase-domain-containing protein [Podospora didyma]